MFDTRPTFSRRNPAPEVTFVRDDKPFVATVEGKLRPVFKVHSKVRCDMCEYEYGNQRKHPVSHEHEGLVVICGDVLVRVID